MGCTRMVYIFGRGGFCLTDGMIGEFQGGAGTTTDQNKKVRWMFFASQFFGHRNIIFFA